MPARIEPRTLMLKGGQRSTTILIGIGLVLVGLLGGILLMLVVGPLGRVQPEPRSPASIELGGGERVQPTISADSLSPTDVSQLATLNELFRRVADQVTPAVVYIQVEGEAASERFPGPDDEAQRRFFGGPLPPRRSVGSGVLVSKQGHIVTNYHVVSEADEILVTLADKRQYEAQVIGRDAATDLAVLEVDVATELPVVAFGNSDDVSVGEWVIAVGNPFRLTSTVTAGIVSALGRQINVNSSDLGIEDFIQTDAAINPGNSGGALVNLQGELVGISTAIATESGSYEGYGFAIPSNLMERVVQDLIAYGEFRRAYLGITIAEVNASVARENDLQRIRGVYISSVHPNGSAYEAGLRDGDVVLAVDERPVNAPNELQSVVALNRPGDEVRLDVWRDGQERAFAVELMGDTEWLGEPQDSTPPPQDRTPPLPEMPEGELQEIEPWGIGLRDLTRGEQSAFGVREGAYVAYVQRGSPAEEGGLPRDVVIVSVDGEPVVSSEDATRVFEGAGHAEDGFVLMQVQRRDGTTAFYETPVPAAP